MTKEDTKATIFLLPRELRDVIYSHAFGSYQRFFHYGRLGFLTSPDPNVSERASPDIEGLPLWILTSRSICDEAIAFLLRTQRFTPNTPTHQCQPPPRRSDRCTAPWHPPRLTGRQKSRLKHEQRQRERIMRGESVKPQLRKPRAAHAVYLPKSDAQPAPALSCSPVSQSLLLHPNSVQHIALNVPVNLTFQRSPGYAFDITLVNDTSPWLEFLALVDPFVRAPRLRLTLTLNARQPEYLAPYFEWPGEWAGRFEEVRVVLLATDASSLEMKGRVEEVVGKLVGRGRQDGGWLGWRMEEVFEKSALPPCEAHGEICPYREVQRSRRSELSRYLLQVES